MRRRDLKEKLLEKLFDYDPVEEVVEILKIYGRKVSLEEAQRNIRTTFFIGTRDGLYKVIVTKKKIITREGIKWKLILEKEDPF